ncbi:MAG: hypothetical protein HKO62_09910, partial [Gammaproteobacteria bacterium]|nr:hypothetical protein [Gammaproteobacteria bacterium]
TPGYLERIARRFARPATNTTTIWRSVPHDEIARIMAATDVVFLGHQEGLNSGLIALAASYAKPVVYPNLGNFREQLAGWNWGEEYEVGNVDSAAAALRRLRERWPRQSDAASTFDNRAWLDAQAWQKHVEVVENAIAARRNATS